MAPEPAASATSGSPVVVVRRVAIPEYLVARRVRYRADASTLAEWPNTYWAERIEIGVTREFVAALRRQLPGWTVCDVQCLEPAAGAASLQLELVPMDYLRASQTLQARARIVLDGRAPQERGYEIRAGADSAQAQADALAQLLRRVAADAAPLVKASAR